MDVSSYSVNKMNPRFRRYNIEDGPQGPSKQKSKRDSRAAIEEDRREKEKE